VNGYTALHFAVKYRRFLELKEMLLKGGNPLIRNKHGESAEDFLRRDPNQNSDHLPEIWNMIEEMKTNLPEETNESLVHAAVRKNDLKKIKFYHKIGAPLVSFNLMGQTPLELAQQLGFDEIEQFIEKQTSEDDSFRFESFTNEDNLFEVIM
jgi:ankyrin repeat protein